MLQRFKKTLAAVCVFALVLSALPQPVSAAATPAWSKKYTAYYENGTRNGIFPYTIKNLTVGQTVKWSLSGTGAQYATLAKTSTVATSKKVSNTLTIRTNGKKAAKNKLVNVTAKIYDKNGKLKHTLTTGNIKIKIKPTAIEVVTTSLPSQLLIGHSYPLSYRVTPANATCTKVWSATYSDGTDASDCITSGGLFTPNKEDTYKITISATIGSKTHASGSTTISVATSLTEVKQTGIDQLVATYSGDARASVKKESFLLTNAYGLSEMIKDIAFSEDGTQVTINLYSTFRDGETYTLTDGATTQSFTAKVGKPTSLVLLTQTVTVNKLTTLKYAIYDENGFDVTSLYLGTLTCSAQIINGYISPNANQVFMTTVGESGTIIITYTFLDTTLKPLQATGTILCVAAVPSGETNFTLIESSDAPDYSAASYADNRSVYADHSYFVHFRALDTNGEALPVDPLTITYTSSDPDTLVVNNTNGTVVATAVKPGTVTVLVTINYGGQIDTHSYTVTITPSPYLASLNADRTTLTTSNHYPDGYKQYINVTAYDQNGQSFELTGETPQIIDNNASKPNLANYDEATNRIEITPYNCAAGSYSYSLTLTVNGKSASLSFTVTVQTPPESGTSAYQVEIDSPIINLDPNADTTLETFISDRAVTIRLAEYRGGIFYQYHNIEYVQVSKNGVYYTKDLTNGPIANTDDNTIKAEVTTPAGIVLNTVTLNEGKTEYTAADPGIYNVQVWFYPESSPENIACQSASFELRNTQATPTVTVTRSVASTRCGTVLDLLRNCLSVFNGTITDCVITGSSKTAASTLQPGEMINIKSVTVEISTTIADGKKLSYKVTVDVGRTLKNL